MDSHVIKLSGNAELGAPLKIGHNIHVTLEGSIISETIADNDDGSATHYYKFRPVIVEALTERGERIRAKDTRSRSQQLRALLFRKWRDENSNESFDEYYDKAMLEIMQQV